MKQEENQNDRKVENSLDEIKPNSNLNVSKKINKPLKQINKSLKKQKQRIPTKIS